MSDTFQVAKSQCDQCLFSANRIVSKKRAAQLIQDCLRKDTFFVCHKATIAGQTVCCRGFFDAYKNDVLISRAAQMFHCVEEVDVERDLRSEPTEYARERDEMMFNPGDKVMKRNEHNASNWGLVLDIEPSPRKSGHIAVRFERQVWIKPENLMLRDEWKAEQKKTKRDIKNFWL